MDSPLHRNETSQDDKDSLLPGAASSAGLRPSPSKPPNASSRTKRIIAASAKHAATLAIALGAVLAVINIWQYYVTAPWTRNGSIRVQVANVAPQISGKIVELRVADNQRVRKGDVLYVIDSYDYDVAVRIGKAMVDQRAADADVKRAESERRQHLSNLATSPEQQQIYAGAAVQANAAYEAATHQLAQAELNLKRTHVTSPVNGYVTNLLLRAGDYASTGISNLAVIDSDSFWIDGYFEETKMANICTGYRAEAQLMGYATPIIGHVHTVTRGISVANASTGAQGLPSVDPVYTWVRLAQRVPVRISIDRVPDGVPLVSGMTATVTIRPPSTDRTRTWLDRVSAMAFNPTFYLLVGGPPLQPECFLASGDTLRPEVIPVSEQTPAPPPEAVVPGLTPGLDAAPQVR